MRESSEFPHFWLKANFGSFSVDSRTHLVTRQGVEVHLTPKAFQLLVLLFKNRPVALSKRQIQEHLWPDCFVSEGSVANLVSELRKRLTENGISPIRTRHRVGYAFASEIPDQGSQNTPLAHLLESEGGGSYDLLEGETLIGRGSNCRVRISSVTVSRNHARIRLLKEGATLEDLGSRNGTCVNAEKVTGSVILTDGAAIRLGAVELFFRLGPLGDIETEDLP